MKRKLTQLLSIIAITTPIVGVVACNSSDNVNSKKKLALIVSNKSNVFFQNIYEAAKAEAMKYGYELDVYDSEDKEENETNNVNTIITKGYAGVLYNPIHSTGSKTAAQKLIRKQIPIVAIDRGFDNLDVVATIATNNQISAKAEVNDAIAFLKSKQPTTPSFKVYELKGRSGAAAATSRHEGFEEAMAADSKFQLVGSNVADWNTAKALEKTNAIKTTHPNIDLIFAANDNMAMGVVKAYEGIPTYPIIIGFDGIDAAKILVDSGKMYATVIQDTTKMAQKAVDAMLEKLNFKDFTDIQGIANEQISLRGIIYKNINWPSPK